MPRCSCAFTEKVEVVVGLTVFIVIPSISQGSLSHAICEQYSGRESLISFLPTLDVSFRTFLNFEIFFPSFSLTFICLENCVICPIKMTHGLDLAVHPV